MMAQSNTGEELAPAHRGEFCSAAGKSYTYVVRDSYIRADSLLVVSMKKLFDQAFWRELLGFLAILAVSFSLLIVANAYRDARENYAAQVRALQNDE